MSSVQSTRRVAQYLHDPDAGAGGDLMRDIDAFLPEAQFFTREDLLHLPAFQHVATITRYHYVCRAVRYLIRSGQIAEKGRVDLCLAGQQARYDDAAHLADRYTSTIKRIAEQQRKPFRVMDVVTLWQSDHHLTESTKRTLVRTVLRRLENDRTIDVDGYTYKSHARPA